MDYFNSRNIVGSTMTELRLKVEEVLKTEVFDVLTEINI